MSCLYDRYNECQCFRYLDQESSTILFDILNCEHQINYNLNYNSAPCNCHCQQQRTVWLKNPEETCQVALSVVVKTINFMSSLPCFRHLPPKDQMSLLQSCWATLFLLGLVQERMTLEVTDVPTATMLKKLLLVGTEQGVLGVSERAQPSLAEVNKLKSFLQKLWNMDLRPKEYAYLKRAMLFNSGSPNSCSPDGMEQRFSSDALFQSLKDQNSGISHDSGYEELLQSSKLEPPESKCDGIKPFSLDCSLSREMSKEKLPQNNALTGSASFNSATSRKDRRSAKDSERSPRKDMKKENSFSSGWCETPKTYKKDALLRRRLLVSRAATDEKMGKTKASDSWLCSSSDDPRLEDYFSRNFDSPDSKLFEALATSTLKNEESLLCRKKRLLFSQVITSTLEDGKTKTVLPSASEAAITNLLASQGDLSEKIITSFPHHLAPECLETPHQCKFTISTKENFQTPVRDLAMNLSTDLGVLSTPTLTPISKLDTSACEDSGFSSLGLNKSQDSSVDHDGSFQELLLQSATRGNETLRVTETRRRSRLERQRRLSTLKEGGSQSEEDRRLAESISSHAELRLGQHKALTAEEDDELFLEKTPLGTTAVKLEDLSLTPALQMVYAMCQRNARRLPEQTSLEELLRSTEGTQAFKTTLPLAGLIGRKMGLERLDILSELKRRNMRHVLAIVLNLLSSEDIYRFSQVSNVWDEIILQDKAANRRRSSYLKDLKIAQELGGAAHVSDADTRMNLQCRSALRSVQAQSKTPVTCTPTLGNGTFTPVQHKAHSASKQDEFLQVAKTLFNDEWLKPCPRCQHPARCHSVKREGICSRDDCGFQFCTGCLCAYHGSKECGSWSAKRRSKKEVLPGSAQSKRNLRRL